VVLLQVTGSSDVIELRYRTNTNDQTAASAFRFPNGTLHDYGFPLKMSSSSSERGFDLSSLVFVTAATRNRLHVDMDAIAIVQALFPNNTIYFYDLTDMSRTDVSKVSYPRNEVKSP